MSSSCEFEPSSGELSAEDIRRSAPEPDPGDEPTRFVAPTSSGAASPEPDAETDDAERAPPPEPHAEAPSGPDEPEPEWLAPPPRRRRRSRGFTIAVAAAVLVIIGSLVAVASLTSRGDDSPVAAAPSSRPPAPAPPKPKPPPARPPAGPDAVVASAQTIMDGFNKRDVRLLQSVSCTTASVGPDIFAGIPVQVRYSVDGKARIAGTASKIHYVAVDTRSGDSNGGDMTMNWDGNRWCFASAG